MIMPLLLISHNIVNLLFSWEKRNLNDNLKICLLVNRFVIKLILQKKCECHNHPTPPGMVVTDIRIG